MVFEEFDINVMSDFHVSRDLVMTYFYLFGVITSVFLSL